MPEWVFIDASILKAARERKGLSYETMAREVHVSSKTWERYEKGGRIPRPILALVAQVLDLEIEEPARERVTVRTVAVDDGEIMTRLGDLERLIQSIDRKLDVANVDQRLKLIERDVGRLVQGLPQTTH